MNPKIKNYVEETLIILSVITVFINFEFNIFELTGSGENLCNSYFYP